MRPLEWSRQTPVAFFVFNRPDTTRRVFEVIRRAAPRTLLFIADGPRSARAGEAERCEAVRKIIAETDWPCTVETNLAESNLGCRGRVSTGLDWVFERVERAIVLEDDCLPEASFFRFCDELLDRYIDDPRVMHIGGSSFGLVPANYPTSYFFSRLPHIWGWASWRRAWRYYDVTMADWAAWRQTGWLGEQVSAATALSTWRDIFDTTSDGRLDTWDAQWTYACWRQGGRSILPARNLITNIGIGELATHTRQLHPWANIPVEPLDFPLVHPPSVDLDYSLDQHMEEKMFAAPGRVRRLAGALWAQLKIARRQLSVRFGR